MGKKNYKRIIGFDMDGVIINHAPVKVRLAKRFGLKLRLEDTQSEMIKKFIDKPVLEKFHKVLYYDPEFFKSAPLMAGVKSGLSKLGRNGLPFFLISRRREPEVAVELLKHHGLWPNFFNEKNSFFVAEPEDKNIKARELGITHYVDDEFEVLKKLIDVKNRFLFDNIKAFGDVGGGYIRVKSWRELMDGFLK